MKRIANLFWSYPNVLVKVNNDKSRTQVIGSQKEIEVDDDAEIVIFGPVNGGRSDSQAIAEPAVWTPANGVQSMKQFQESARIADERRKLEEEQKAAAARKAKEAKERAHKKTVKVEEKKLDLGKDLEL